MYNFQYGTTSFSYSLEFQEKSKDVAISVGLGEGIRVSAPIGIELTQLDKILYKKAPWIIKKKAALEEIEVPAAPKEFISGEKFSYLGRNYRLKVHRYYNIKNTTLNFKQGRFIAEVPASMADSEKETNLKLSFKDWYTLHGSKKVEERLQIYCPKMQLEPSDVVIKEQQKRWGTCTSDGTIYLNWRIMMAPMQIIDYVLVHELAHLKHQNHSPEYWRFVRSILPDYEHRKEWLRINGPTLIL